VVPPKVIAVEAATGVWRKQRPDLCSERRGDDASTHRCSCFQGVACPCFHAPSCIAWTDRKSGGGCCWVAHAALAEAASEALTRVSEREYFDLFVGFGRGELLPYASYYLTGFLNERPLSRLRGDLASLGIEQAENNFEPEDHAATLCEIMAGLAAGRFPASPEAQRAFFEKHVTPWMGRLFADLESAASAKFYRLVGSLGRLFLEIEAEAFTFAN
jgi:TorA maturation chaperone TorD